MLSHFARRRRSLGMTTAALAARSGVSEPTVKRILGGKSDCASFTNVAAVAEALGITFDLRARDPDELRREQARSKAQRTAQVVQVAGALESQAPDAAEHQRLVERSYHELLAGSGRRLWAP